MRYPRYELQLNYTDQYGKIGFFNAEDDLKQDSLLLAAKMVGYYQARRCTIDKIIITDRFKRENIALPRGLTALY